MERTDGTTNEIFLIISSLAEVEALIQEKARERPSIMNHGGNFIKEIPDNLVMEAVNVYPGGIPGSCHRTFIVGVGRLDDVEKHILAAIEHILVDCPNTANVLFWGNHWDDAIFSKHSRAFKNVKVSTKFF